jgi:hypothetical protein
MLDIVCDFGWRLQWPRIRETNKKSLPRRSVVLWALAVLAMFVCSHHDALSCVPIPFGELDGGHGLDSPAARRVATRRRKGGRCNRQLTA